MKRFAICLAAMLSMAAGSCCAQDDKAAALEVVEKYHSMVEYPSPADIDPEIFAENIRAFWSGGDILEGRDAVIAGLKKAREQVKTLFKSLKLEPEDEEVSIEGDRALVTGILKFNGKLNPDGKAYQRVVRYTFILDKSGGKWRIIHEHSSVKLQVEPKSDR